MVPDVSEQPHDQHASPLPTQTTLHKKLEEVSIADLAVMLWNRKWFLVFSVIACLILAVAYLHIATYKYTASLTVFPVGQERSGLGGTLGRLGELASIGGISLPTDQAAIPFIQYAEGLRSYHTAEQIASDQSLMTQIFREEWNNEKGLYQEPTDWNYVLIKSIKSLLGVPSADWSPPGAARVHDILQRSLDVTEESKKPIIRISWEHPNGELAAIFVQAIHDTVDNSIRAKSRLRSEENIRYLESQLQTVQLAEHRAALAQSLSEQEKLRMSASASVPYVAEPTGTPTISNRPTSPRPILVLAIAIMAGGIIGIAIAFIFPKRSES